MAKRKGPKIIFSDIKTFQELDNLQRIIEIRYGYGAQNEAYEVGCGSGRRKSFVYKGLGGVGE